LLTLTSRWAIAVSLIALAAGSDAIADTRKAVLTVSATVVRTAEIATIDSLNFGSNDPTAPRTPITVRATKGMTYRIHAAADRTATSGAGVSAGRDVHPLLVTIDW